MRITFTGDILCEQQQIVALGKESHNVALKGISDAFSNSDIIVGALETPVAPSMPLCTHKWSFNAPESFVEMLVSQNIKYVSTANNHCLDRGIEGLKETIEILDKYDIKHIGTYAEKSQPHHIIIDTGSKKVGLISFTYGTNSGFNGNILSDEDLWMVDLLSPQEPQWEIPSKYYRFNIPLRVFNKIKKYWGRQKQSDTDVINVARIRETIENTRQEGADFIIVSAHQGGQYNFEPTDYSRKVCGILADCGADLIIGNHEHVILPSEKIGNKVFTAYCLGNLLSSPDSHAGDGIANISIDRATTSIILHVDFMEGEPKPAMSFQIAHTVLNNGIAETYLLYDLIQAAADSDERERLIRLNESSVRMFKNNHNDIVKLQRIYKI